MSPESRTRGFHVARSRLGVDSQKSLHNIGAELSKDREISVDENGCLHAYDILGIGIAFQVKDEVEYTDEAPVLNFRNHEPRLNRTMEYTQKVRTRPYRIGHVVYTYPTEQREETVRFYTE